MRSDGNLTGIVFMTLGFFSFAASDVLAKLLTDAFHPFQIVWLRTLGLTIGVAILVLRSRGAILKARKPLHQVTRGVMAVGSAVLFISAVRHVPLADAVAVTFVSPFIVTVFAALILKEPVGIRRWFAVAAGFIGVMIVIRPGMGVFHPAISLAFLAATLFAMRQLVSRWLSGIDDVVTTIAYTAIVAFVLSGLVQPFVWITPAGATQLLLILGLTATASLGEILIIKALDIAQSVVLAPLHYTLILWSTLYGFLVFNDLPDRWTLIGSAIIVVSGLYTIYREHRLKQAPLQINEP